MGEVKNEVTGWD